MVGRVHRVCGGSAKVKKMPFHEAGCDRDKLQNCEFQKTRLLTMNNTKYINKREFSALLADALLLVLLVLMQPLLL
jgi:hypothetical protein